MTDDLLTGAGVCQATARLVVQPSVPVIELGAAPDILSRVLAAVHHANRHGEREDFIAVALPAMNMGHHCMRPGLRLELVGSPDSLSALTRLEGIERLRNREMIRALDLEMVGGDPMTTAAGYIRDRKAEKGTPGWIRRTENRAARRGRPIGQEITPKGHDRTALRLEIGQAVLSIRQITGPFVPGRPIHVSTYGFSSTMAPAVLPVAPSTAIKRRTKDLAMA